MAFYFNIFNFFENYFVHLKIKEAAYTLGIVYIFCNVKPIGGYVSVKKGIVKVPYCFQWDMKGFLIY